MEPQLILLRVEFQYQSPSNTINSPRAFKGNHFTGISKWDINHPFHLAMQEKNGILQTYTLETTGGDSKAYLYPCSSFQLHLDFRPSELHRDSQGLHNYMKSSSSNNKNNKDGISSLWLGHGRKCNDEPTRTRPIEQVWGSFEFIPHRRSEIVFFQDGSSRILFVRLPGGSPRGLIQGREKSIAKIDSRKSKVYCLGRHSSTILSIAVRGDGLVLVSAARDGQLRIWRISDGSMLGQTMFSRWRQPRSPQSPLSPPQGRCTNSSFQTDNVEVLKDQIILSSPIQVLSFLGKSSDFCMGCPNGEVRIWNLIESENSRLEIQEVENVVAGNVMVGKDVITSIAVHVPDCNFPMLCNDGDNQTCSHSHEAFIAIGTMKQKLQVWNKHTILSEWIPLWSTILSNEGASIVSLSFRADGGLLALAASRFAKPIGVNECIDSSSTSTSKSQKQPCDCLYLYNTSSWACVGQLNFTSNLGSCLFYHPHFKVEDKDEPSSSTSQDKVWSCRLLLVSTSGGPQTHILPEYGLLGSSKNQCKQHEMDHLNCTKEAKNVHWADHKGKLGSNCPRSCNNETQQHWEDDGDGTSSCDTYPMKNHMGSNENTSDSFLAMDLDKDEMSHPMSPQSSNERPAEDEEIGLQGLRKVAFQKHHISPQSHHHRKMKKEKHLSNNASKERISKQRVNEANVVPRSHPIIKKPKFKKQLPSGGLTKSCKHCKLKSLNFGFGKHHHNISSSSYSPFWLSLSCLENFQEDNIFAHENIPKVEESCFRTHISTTPISSEQNVETQTTFVIPCQNVEEHHPNTKRKKEVTFTNLKTPEVIPNHFGGKSPSSKPTISHSRKKGGNSHLSISTNMKSSCSKRQYPESHDQQKPSTRDKPNKAQRCNRVDSQSHILGGVELNELLAMNEESSPYKDIVRMGGTFRERSPASRPIVAAAMMVDPPKTSQKDKVGLGLDQPVAFSTTSLMQRLKDIEHETFNLEAALQVAKAKGIVLSKYDREAIKSALEEETKQGFSKCEPEFEGRKPSARYIPLLKIPDPRIAYTSPIVATRKVRKQIDNVKGEDLPTIQPALFDLWDLHERCPQVSSANLEQANTFTATSWRRALGGLEETNKNSVWIQREDVCRAAASAQAIYDSCLYKPDPEPKCQCYQRDHDVFDVR